jgi:hypothetical protein
MAQPVVGIVGAKALRKDLSRLADDVTSPLYKAMKQAGRDAAEPVAAAVRAALPHVTGTLAGDVRTSGTKTGAAVRMGRASVPYAGWVEFGGTRKKPHYSERPFIKTGRYMFPAARPLAEQAARSYSDALAVLFERSDIWTNTTSDGSAVRD